MNLKIQKKSGTITRKLGALALVVLLCCYSSYSLAYDQQYQVGGTGPQGGTVTSVSIASEVTGTTTSQVGDNLETITAIAH